MSFKFLHTFLIFLLLGCSLEGWTQGIQDACLFGLNNSADFANTGDLTNTGGADGGFYNGSSWQGPSVSVGPPYECENPRAIFISSNGDVKDAVGFRLNGFLTANTVFNVPTRFTQTGGNFSMSIYTSTNGQFYDGNTILANQVGTINVGNGNWQNGAINFFVPNESAGHSWIFLRAENGSGGIANFCQFGLELPEVDFGPDQDICDGVQVTLDMTNNAANYVWSTGQNSASISVGNQGIYTGEASNTCGAVTDEIEITVFEEPELNVTQDTVICVGTELVLSAEGWEPTYLWNDGSTNPTLTVDSAGFYSVTVTDNCFITTDDVIVDYLGPPEVELGPDSAVCGGTVDYYVASGGATSVYSWSNGAAGPGISITETGNYEVTITNICGTASDDVFVEFSYGPGDFLVDSVEFCEGTDMIVDVSWVEGYFDWSDDSTNPIFTVPNEGWHYVSIVDDDSCWVASDTIFVDRIFCDCPMHIANSFTPNGDGVNEEFGAVFECPPYDYELTILDRWGRTVFYTKDPEETWNGTADGNELLPTGVFTYLLRYTNQFNGFINASTGSVFLMKD